MILSTLKAIAAVTVITAPSMRTSNSLQTGLDWGWSSFMQTHGVSMTPTSTLVATYSNYESDFNGLYDFSIGFVETQPRDNLQAFTLPAGKYLVFSGQGSIPQITQEAWMHIWQFFQTSTEYQRAYTTDYEMYDLSKPGSIEVYIAVK